MPVEALAMETGLVIDAGLVHVNVAAKNLAYPTEQARILGEFAKSFRQDMHGEQGANFLTARLGDAEIAAPELLSAQQLMQGAGEFRHFVFAQETGLEQKAAAFELIQLRRAQRTVLGTALDHRLATVQPRQIRATGKTGGVWIIPPGVGLGGAGLRLH